MKISITGEGKPTQIVSTCFLVIAIFINFSSTVVLPVYYAIVGGVPKRLSIAFAIFGVACLIKAIFFMEEEKRSNV
jgi:hypothetical protein